MKVFCIQTCKWYKITLVLFSYYLWIYMDSYKACYKTNSLLHVMVHSSCYMFLFCVDITLSILSVVYNCDLIYRSQIRGFCETFCEEMLDVQYWLLTHVDLLGLVRAWWCTDDKYSLTPNNISKSYLISEHCIFMNNAGSLFQARLYCCM